MASRNEKPWSPVHWLIRFWNRHHHEPFPYNFWQFLPPITSSFAFFRCGCNKVETRRVASTFAMWSPLVLVDTNYIHRWTFSTESFALSAFLRNFVAVKTNECFDYGKVHQPVHRRRFLKNMEFNDFHKKILLRRKTAQYTANFASWTRKKCTNW